MPVSGGQSVLLRQIRIERVTFSEGLKVLGEPIANDEPTRAVAHESVPAKTTLQSLQRRSSASSSSSAALLTRSAHLRPLSHHSWCAQKSECRSSITPRMWGNKLNKRIKCEVSSRFSVSLR